MFKSVKDFPAYRISNDGTIETCWTWGAYYIGMSGTAKWKALPLKPNKKGYIPVHLRDIGGKGRRTHLHRLIAETFISPAPFARACVRHLDGNTSNNSVENLAWGTYLENENDKLGHGTHRSRITNSKLAPGTISLAREMRSKGESMSVIAEHIGVSRPTISRLLSGKTWGD